MAIMKFNYDHWEAVKLMDLELGDWVSYEGGMYVVQANANKKNGVKIIKWSDEECGAVELLTGYNHVAEAMDRCCTSLQRFNDGTVMLCDFDGIPHVYSPRLKIDELETFCREHIEIYRRFYAQYHAKLESGKHVTLKPFWK